MSLNDPERVEQPSLADQFRNRVDATRQWMQPAAFRIAAPPSSISNSHEPVDDLIPSAPAEERLNIALKTIAAVATAVWRAKSKLDSEASRELPTELRNLPRHVQAAWDALAAGQVQVDDPIGRRYLPGMAVNTLTIQPVEGITIELILETIKPSVYFQDVLIQRADVIVARPAAETEVPCVDEVTARETESKSPDFPHEKGSEADGPDDH